MIITYINLDSAVSRRDALEASFAESCPKNIPWELVRFSAVSDQDEAVKKVAGFRSAKEKACLLSHYSVLKQACESDAYNWIIEDDICFTKKSFQTVATYLNLYKDTDWDIIFTAIDARSPAHMFELFYHRESVANGEIMVADLADLPFASASSYLINPKRKEKIMAVLADHDFKDCAWDLLLSQLVIDKKLKAFVTIPFVTELSDHSAYSQIQVDEAKSTELFIYSFRKLMGVSNNVEEAEKLLGMIGGDYFNDRSNCFGKIISGITSKKFVTK